MTELTQAPRQILNSGQWAGQRLLKAMKEGRGLDPAVLRTADTLRKDEWEFLDNELVEEGTIRLQGVADLIGAGLTRPVGNALGKTIFQYEKVSDMEPAEVSMNGNSRTPNDRQEFNLNNIPLPITHKDFWIDLRTLEASRQTGETLDTTQVRTAGRLVTEETEKMLFQGGKKFGGFDIYGYTTHPDRNLDSFGAAHWGNAATTGEEMLTDLLSMIAAAHADRFYGPYWLYVPSDASVNLSKDFKTNSDKSIRQRLMEVEGIQAIRVVDQLPSANLVLVQATMDVAAMITGTPLQTVQWDINGGFTINFKAWQILIPLIRSDNDGRSGVVHMS